MLRRSKEKSTSPRPFESLAQAVIKQAMQDYPLADTRLFFESEWSDYLMEVGQMDKSKVRKELELKMRDFPLKCRVCGGGFYGGPHAKVCPACKRKAVLEGKRRAREKQKKTLRWLD